MTLSLAACMVTFESAHVVRRSLDALKATAAGSGLDVSLTVVDNASTDGSAEAVEATWPDARIIRNDRNLGYGPAINQAAAGSSADWLLFVNPDTRAAPGLLPMLPHVHELGEIGAFTPMLTDASGRPARTAYRWPTLGKELARLSGVVAAAGRVGRTADGLPGERTAFPEPVGEAVRIDYPVGACLFVRGDAWRRIGPFDEGFVLYHEEMEWCWRAARAGVGVFALPRVRAVHLGMASSRRRPAEVVLWRYRGLLRFYELHRSRSERAALRAAMAASFAARAAGAGLTGRSNARALWAVSRLGARGSGPADRDRA